MSDNHEQVTFEHIREAAARLRSPLPLRRIIVFLAGESLADFVLQNLIAAWVVRRFHGVHATAVFHAEPRERSVVFACNRDIQGSLTAESDIVMPVDWFDVGALAPVKCDDPEWIKHDLTRPDLVLLPGMLSLDASRLAGLAEDPPRFQLPYGQAPGWANRLIARGLDREAWFACVDAGLSEEDLAPLIRHLTKVQGGAVALLGRDIPPSLKGLDGVLVLEAGDAAFEETATAIALARYVIAKDPLVLSLASAFGTPCAGVNMLRFGHCLWRANDIVMGKSLRLDDGRRPGTREAHALGLLDGTLPDGAIAEDRPLEEIIAVADRRLAGTSDCTGWLRPVPATHAQEAPGLDFPFPLRDAPMVTFWD